MRRRTTAPEASAASSLEKLAVLLEAGVAPGSAWRHVAECAGDEEERRILRAVSEAVTGGRPGSEALAAAVGDETGRTVARAHWLQAAAAWEVAEVSGTPLASCLRSSADAARVLVQARRDARVAASGPVATARIVLALPAFGILLALGLGVDTVGVLVGTTVGWGCVIGACILVALARFWNGRLLAAAAPPDGVPALDLELIALAIAGGGEWAAARGRVQVALERHCPDIAMPTDPREIDALIELSERAGVPAGGLLRSTADELRREARARAAEATERLGVRLMLPLGICVLPAFVLVGVVPLVVALLASTGIGG